MRYIFFISSFILAAIVLFGSCAKWQDPAPVTDPRLTNLYCNNPSAVNYNLGFPGKPDNGVCLFPSDLFQGTYLLKDSVYLASGRFIGADSLVLKIVRLSDSKIGVIGFCSSGAQLSLTAGPTYQATVDTTLGDSTTLNLGQLFCRTRDTVSGYITKDRVDSNLLHVALQVVSDTGMTAIIGKARKL